MTSEVYRRGLEIRSEVLGSEYVQAAVAGADAFNRPFQELVTSACWGGVWGDEALSRRQRSLLVLAILAYALFSQQWLWLLAMPLAGYGFAWVGHFVFEKNRPATFDYPLYSLMGDWVMLKDAFTGRIRF